MVQASKNSRVIKASSTKVFHAFLDAGALEQWQAPGNMRAKVHHFDPKVGGGYTMSLFYPDNENKMKGKTTDKEDKFTACFIEIIPNKKIVATIHFDTHDPLFSGEMIMEVLFDATSTGIRVTISFENIPAGIRPEDNEAGTNASLEKLAKYVESI